MLFHNKDYESKKLSATIEKIKEYLQNEDKLLVSMSRGEHIGSNKGREGDANVVAMSLFTRLSDYVLRAAIAYDKNIDADAIWTHDKKGPRWSRAGGFADKRIQYAFVRQVVSDLYQTIMRGRIRSDAKAEYQVICLLTGYDCISVLEKLLPEATFDYPFRYYMDMLMNGKAKNEVVDRMITIEGCEKETAKYRVDALLKCLQNSRDSVA